MDDPAQQPEEFANAFETAFVQLRLRIETACAAEPDWTSGVAAGLRVAFIFAATNPSAARALTTDALAAGKPGFAHYERLISYLRAMLVRGRAERAAAEHLPDETERALAGGIAMLVAQRIDTGRHAELPALAQEATQFVLTPYLGLAEAQRIATQHPPDPHPQRDRQSR